MTEDRTPAANLLALGLGADPSEEAEAEELEAFLCAMPDLELHACLGRGGMGRVYRARQTRLDRFVALKLMNAELGSDPEFRERFEREARALARLDHPGIVRVHEFGEAGGRFYLVMELVQGPNLRELMAGQLDAHEASQLIGQLCDALSYAHGRGVVHRDIKPENVLVDPDGRVRVADFGLAKLQRVEPLATTRRVVGTPQYMAPEQLTDPASVDHRADVFAIGVVFYEMLTGHLPVGRFPSPSEVGRGDSILDAVVLRALESNREKRFQAASEIRVALDSRLENDPATLTEPGGLAVPPASRRPWTVAGGAIAAGLLGTAVLVAVETDPPSPGAEAEVARPLEEPASGGDDAGGSVEAGAVPADAEAPARVAAPTSDRWPMPDLVVLAPDTAGVVGIDVSELRQAPALARIAAAVDNDQEECRPLLAQTHKVVATIGHDGELQELYVHADWDPLLFLRCTSNSKKAKEAGEVGGFTLYELETRTVAVHRDHARILISYRKDLKPDVADALLGSAGDKSDIATRMAGRVDLDAPIWVMASPVPEDFGEHLTGVWGRLDLWERLEVQGTAVFDSEGAAAEARSLLQSYKTILANVEDAPAIELSLEQSGTSLAVKGAVEIPKDFGTHGDGHFRFGESDNGVGFNLSLGHSSKQSSKKK